ncbi:MAG: DUF4340 domain-containing protein [Candidatus Schekmanbacteria bacterium]|nr:DUF4340 domain-containing protein [Candidatus Schekmanbacteria bacterium]
MKLGKTVGLVLIAAGLGAYVYFFERTDKGAEDTPEELEKVVVEIPKDSVVKIAITGAPPASPESPTPAAGSATPVAAPAEPQNVVLTKSGTGEETSWSISDPILARADSGAIDRVLGKIEKLKATRVLKAEDAADLKAFGLDAPRRELQVWDKQDGEPVVIAFGNETFDKANVYAMRRGKAEAFVLPKYHYTDLDKKLDDWRDKKVLPIKKETIGRIELTYGAEAVTLIKSPGVAAASDWVLDGPGPARARVVQKSAADKVLDAAASLEAKAFIDNPEEEASYGLTQPQLTIRLVAEKDAGAWELKLGKAKEGESRLYAKLGSGKTVYELEDKIKGELTLNKSEIVERALASFKEYEVDRLTLAAGEASLEAARKSYDDWQLEKPIKARADAERLKKLATDIAGLQAAAYLTKEEAEKAALSFDSPLLALAITLKPKGDAATGAKHELDVALPAGADKAAAAEYYVRWRGEEGAFKVAGRLLLDLDLSAATAWRDHHPIAFRNFRVTKINAEVEGKKYAAEREEAATWKLTSPVERKANREAVEKLLDGLRELQADEFISDTTTSFGPYGESQPIVSVTLDLGEDGAAALVIGAGASEGGGRYAWEPGKPTLYRVKSEAVKDLMERFTRMTEEASAEPTPEAVTSGDEPDLSGMAGMMEEPDITEEELEAAAGEEEASQ